MRTGRLVLLLGLASTIAAAQSAEADFFERKIRPVIAARCSACHGERAQMGGFSFATAEGFNKAGASRVLQAISYQSPVKMPPTGRLPDAEIEDITAWIKRGAPWPAGAQKNNQQIWWVMAPSKPAVPQARNSSWASNPIDNFILARLEGNGLAAAPPASKAVLLRRATYDLTGLPPTPQELQEFLLDKSPDAYTRVVDRLLASPRYGERWGRHWLDVARYADSNGLTNDRLYSNAWRYRDYVIDAFNRDLPYDRFVMEQIAGDLMPATTGEPVNRNGIVATGFLAIGPKPFVEQDKVRMVYDAVDEQIDTTSRAFLGLTVACARCHDHKFDPISTKDYYSMAAIFAATKTFAQVPGPSRPYQKPLVAADLYAPYERRQQEIAAKLREITRVTEQATDGYRANLRPQLAGYMVAAWRAARNEQTEAGLDPVILKKWVEYYQAKSPAAGQRPHLDEWLHAGSDTIQAVASAYEARFDAAERRWRQQEAEWDNEVEAVLAKGLVPNLRPPFKPEQPEDRFFADAGFGAGPFGLPRREPEKYFPPEVREKLVALRKELDTLKKSAPPEPAMASAVGEGEPVREYVHVRGDYKNHGAEVSPGFLRVLAGDNQPKIEQGSGRLELARWLARADNPLTARVMVNRIWQWHFGAGLARTPNNFGKLGEAPTHPELLDYLAVRFVESGWSIKALNRLIMLSSAYQMSSVGRPESRKADPANRLWSRFDRRRLDIEEIRDSMLAFEGALDLKMGGTLLSAVKTVGDDDGETGGVSRDPMQSHRRTVYLPLRRANLWSVLTLFDFVDAATASEGRAHTNVAPQALFMMNSEFVDQRARGLAKRLLGEASTPEALVTLAYLTVFCREPDAEEQADAIKYLAEAEARLAPDKSEEEKRLRAAQSLARALLGSNEAIYLD